MKNIGLVLGALLAAGFGVWIVALTKASAFGIVFGSIFVLIALACMAPVALHTAREEITEGLKSYRNSPPGGAS
jgi:hypothetical protein